MWDARTVPLSATVVLMVAGCALLQVVAVRASETAGRQAAIAGKHIFFGRMPLKGTIPGQKNLLPPERAACINCHPVGSSPTSDGSFAPPLDRSAILEPRRRRNGPPSYFSLDTFCTLLRTGVDPVYIVVNHQMPRFELDDDQCFDLWQYLMEPDNGSHEGK